MRRRTLYHGPALAALLLALLALLSGCGGGNDTYNPTLAGGSAASFTLRVAPPSATVTQGQAATYTATITGVNGFTAPVSLSVSGLPENATAQFVPPVVTPTANGATSTLTVATGGADAPGDLQGTIRSRAISSPGTYTLTITATSGGVTRRATVQLIVAAAGTPMFALAAAPASQSVAAGGATTYVVTVTGSNGFSSPVDLSVTGLPSGATGAFSPVQVMPTATGATSTLTVATTGSTPAGTSTLTITGASGNLTQQATVSLTVTGGSDPGPAAARWSFDIALDATGRFAYLSDLEAPQIGTVGGIRQFGVGADGALIPLSPPGVSEPKYARSLAAHPTLPFLYAVSYSPDSVYTLHQFRIGEFGALTPLATASVPIPGNFPSAISTPEIIIEPTGKFAFTETHQGTVRAFLVGADGALTPVGEEFSSPNPNAIAVGPATANGRFLYVGTLATTTLSGTYTAVSAFRVAEDGKLTRLADLRTDYSVVGVAVDPTGRFVYATGNRSQGGVSDAAVYQYAINADGTLAANGSVSAGPAPTSGGGGRRHLAVTAHPNGRFLYVASIQGGVYQYGINGDGTLTPLSPASVPTGQFPNAVRISPNGQFAFVVNNIEGVNPIESTVSRYRVNGDGTLTPL